MNKIILVGNLTRDPEGGTTANGRSYSRFSIAVNRRFSKDNEADFFNVVAWGTTADSCNNNLTKGRKVAVSGSIQIRNYESNDGTKRTSVEVNADEVEFLSSANRGGEGEERPAPKKSGNDISDLTVVDDELPF